MKSIKGKLVVYSHDEAATMHDHLGTVGYEHVSGMLVEHPEYGKLIEHEYYRDSDQGVTSIYCRLSDA